MTTLKAILLSLSMITNNGLLVVGSKSSGYKLQDQKYIDVVMFILCTHVYVCVHA